MTNRRVVWPPRRHRPTAEELAQEAAWLELLADWAAEAGQDSSASRFRDRASALRGEWTGDRLKTA